MIGCLPGVGEGVGGWQRERERERDRETEKERAAAAPAAAGLQQQGTGTGGAFLVSTDANLPPFSSARLIFAASLLAFPTAIQTSKHQEGTWLVFTQTFIGRTLITKQTPLFITVSG